MGHFIPYWIRNLVQAVSRICSKDFSEVSVDDGTALHANKSQYFDKTSIDPKMGHCVPVLAQHLLRF